jgi:hypothetical protein
MAKSGFQSTVTNPNVAYAGDYVGAKSAMSGLVILGKISSGAVAVSSFVWSIANTDTVVQVKGANTIIAGFVARSQSTPFASSAFEDGNSLSIKDKSLVEIVAKGTMYTTATSLNGGGLFNIGDSVYSDVNGLVTVSTLNPGLGYTDTGFKVIATSIFNATGNLIAISNVRSA